jgi:hypothetical protein
MRELRSFPAFKSLRRRGPRTLPPAQTGSQPVSNARPSRAAHDHIDTDHIDTGHIDTGQIA